MSLIPRGKRLARLVAAVFLLIGAALGPGSVAAPGIFSRQAEALNSGNEIELALGFDTACAPTSAQMQTLWSNSPWFNAGVYVGGANISCKSNANLTASWLNAVHSQGWQFVYFYVGLQATCTPAGKYYVMSSNTSTAQSQGGDAATDAVYILANPLGIPNSAAGTPITYDMEAYGQPSAGSGCQLAVNAFMKGWTSYLHTSPAQLSGYYGSTCSSNVNLQASVSPVVDYIHGANYDSNPNPSVMSCVSSGNWVNNQRLKQYVANVSASNYGVNISVDYDCAHGPTSPSGSQLNANC